MKECIHSQIQRCKCLDLGMDNYFHRTFYLAHDYLSMLGLKLYHVSRWGTGCDTGLTCYLHKTYQTMSIFYYLCCGKLTIRWMWHVHVPAATHLQEIHLLTLYHTGRHVIFIMVREAGRLVALTIWPRQVIHLQKYHNDIMTENRFLHHWPFLGVIHPLQRRHNEPKWRLKPPASGLSAQPFVQAHIKENIKATRYWFLWGESTG